MTASEGFASYRWNTGATSAQIEVGVAQTYKVTVTGDNGCSGSNSITVRKSNAPLLGENQPRYLCRGDTTPSTIALPGFSEYLWSTGDSTESITVNREGEYLVTVTNAIGCTNVSKYVVEQAMRPRAILIAEDVACKDGTAFLAGNLISSGNNSVSYEWYLGTDKLPYNTSVININRGGLYTLTVTDKITGCTASTSEPVKELNIDVQLEVDTSQILSCDNLELLLEANASLDTKHFFWTRETGSITEIFGEDTTSQLNVKIHGIYTVIGRDSSRMCTDTAIIKVTDIISPVTPKPRIEVPLTVCEGEIKELRVSTSYHQYLWSTEDTTSTITDALSGKYEVTVTNEAGCTAIDSVNISTIPVVDLMVDIKSDKPNGVCEGTEAIINFNILDNGQGPYDITYTDGLLEKTISNVEENIAFIEVTPTAENRYEILEIIDKGNTCYTTNSIDTAFLSLNILKRPSASSIGEKICAIEGEKEATFDLKSLEDAIGDGNVVNWYRREDLGERILSDVLRSRTTTLYARATDGICESETIPIELEVEDCSQNLEMTHEAGVALDLSYLEGAEREVYITNRWGDLVYASKDYENTSDKFTGNKLPQGAYYIYIKNDENGLPIPYKGVIYLLK